MAGNADWVIDGNEFNLEQTTIGTVTIGGRESKPSEISSTQTIKYYQHFSRNFWTGGISGWQLI